MHLHYLPHHPVLRTDKETMKLRVIYNVSAKWKPTITERLSANGTKIQSKNLGHSAQISFTFDRGDCRHQESLLDGRSSRKGQRWPSLSLGEGYSWEHDNYPSHTFHSSSFGACCSPYLFNSTIRHHLQQYQSSHPGVAKNLIESFYVDNVVLVAPSKEEAFKLYTESKSILKDGA